MVRNFAEFDWREDSSSDPPGRELAEVLHASFSAIADSVSILDQRDDYGWEFDGRIGKVKFLVVLQHSDRWLVVVDPIVGLVGRIRGVDSTEDLLAACRAVHTALSTREGVTAIHWVTKEELHEGADGSPEPEPV